MYFPWSLPIYVESRALKPYSKLQFPKVSGWGKFIQTYVRETRREPVGHGDVYPPDKHIKDVNNAGAILAGGAGVRDGGDESRDGGDESREMAEADRVLLQLFGSGPLPWSMKNPPQQVRIASAGKAKRKSSPRRPKTTSPGTATEPLPRAPELPTTHRIEAPQPTYHMHS